MVTVDNNATKNVYLSNVDHNTLFDPKFKFRQLYSKQSYEIWI